MVHFIVFQLMAAFMCTNNYWLGVVEPSLSLCVALFGCCHDARSLCVDSIAYDLSLHLFHSSCLFLIQLLFFPLFHTLFVSFTFTGIFVKRRYSFHISHLRVYKFFFSGVWLCVFGLFIGFFLHRFFTMYACMSVESLR